MSTVNFTGPVTEDAEEAFAMTFSIKFINLHVKSEFLFFQTYNSPLIRYKLEQSAADQSLLMYRDTTSTFLLYSLYESQLSIGENPNAFFAIAKELNDYLIQENLRSLRVKFIVNRNRGYVSFVSSCDRARALLYGSSCSELLVLHLHSLKTRRRLENLKRGRLIKCLFLRRFFVVVGKLGVKVYDALGMGRVFWLHDLMANLWSSFFLIIDHKNRQKKETAGESGGLTVVYVNQKDLKNIVRLVTLEKLQMVDEKQSSLLRFKSKNSY